MRYRQISGPGWGGGRPRHGPGTDEADGADARTSARTTERNLHRIALAALLLATLGLRLWGIKQGLPYSYNSDEARHYVPRAIAFFSHDYNPNYFLNPPAYSYLLNIVFELWFGSADAVSRAYASNPTEVFVVARVVVAVLGTLSVWLTYLAGRADVQSHGRAGRGGDLRAGVPADLLQPPGAQRRPDAGPGGAVAVRDGRACCETAPGATTCWRGSAAEWRRRRSTPARSRFVCLLAACLCDGLSGRTVVQSLWRLGLCIAAAAIAFVIANPYSLLDFSAFHAGVTTQQATGRRLRPREARHDRVQRHRVLPVDLHVGAGLGPIAGGGGRGDRAAGPPSAGARAGTDSRADRVHHLHGRPAAVLRPLADADVPDRGAARRPTARSRWVAG